MEIDTIEKMKEYEYIPNLLIEFVASSLRLNVRNNLIISLQRNFEQTMNAISDMFRMATEFTGISPEKLLLRTGFKIKDRNFERIDSAFSEIRAINFLGLSGFDDISIIHNNAKKYSDIIASRNGKRVCFEVMTITEAAQNKWNHEKLFEFINFRLKEKGKLQQLQNTKIDYNCDFMNLLVVITNQAGVALNTRNDYMSILMELYKDNNIQELTFSIVTGRVDYFTGTPDDCIYPELY